MPSEYSLDLWSALERTLSKGRLTYYLDLVEEKMGRAGGTEDLKRQRAFELHHWNTKLSESLYLPLQVFEITLRNRIDGSISAYHKKHFGTREWYQDARWPSTWCTATDRNGKPYVNRTIDAIERALHDSQKTKWLRHSTAHSHFVAATMLGFWVDFLSPEYEHLWTEILQSAFWQGANRVELHRLARQTNDIRNRMAHYEPIIVKRKNDLELDQLHEKILRYIKALCEETSDWVRRTSSFETAWDTRPHWW
jgi:hypothetical protein